MNEAINESIDNLFPRVQKNIMAQYFVLLEPWIKKTAVKYRIDSQVLIADFQEKYQKMLEGTTLSAKYRFALPPTLKEQMLSKIDNLAQSMKGAA